MFTDGSRVDSGAAGHAVRVHGRVGHKLQMGFNKFDAYVTECAALVRALESAVRRRPLPERVTIFTDAQAAISRMASEDPGPGQCYAIQARKHIATLGKASPDMVIEIRWRPAHEGILGNEKAYEWAKLAAEEPDARGVEWHRYADRYGKRPVSLPRSLTYLKREILERKWKEAKEWVDGVQFSPDHRRNREFSTG
jgi:ribonuclease HI